jgi:PAS domain S-box-containing protein
MPMERAAVPEVNTDVSHSTTAEEDRGRLAAIVESSDDAIIGKSLDGTITSWNRGAQQLYGYTADEAVGRSISMLVPPDHPDEVPFILEQIRRGEKVDHYQTVRMSREGRLIDVSLTVSPIRNAAGQVIGASSVARDISEQKRILAALEETNAELEAFAYSVSHDLKAPLRSMRGFAQALLEDYGDRLDPEGQEYAGRIMAAADRLHGMIQDLLAYSRVSRTSLELRPVRLGQVVAEALEQMETFLREQDAGVTVEEPLPDVLGHAPTLVQVAANLLSNAAKFVPEGRRPRVRVWAEAGSGKVRLWVEDNGIGIPVEYQQQVFRVFERLHGDESYPGTGIGLAIVRKGAERMEGRAGVESKTGCGSRFWVELRKAPAGP